MTSEQKALNMLGLAKRAGRVVSGEFSTEKAVKTGKARLVLVASDASANTRKMFSDMCAWYKVPILVFARKAELGHAIGQEMRASAAVTDENFARTIEQRIREINCEERVDENDNGGSEYGGNE